MKVGSVPLCFFNPGKPWTVRLQPLGNLPFMRKNRSKTVKEVALPKLEDFSHQEIEEIYEFSKVFCH
jgi:hypothetical protein